MDPATLTAIIQGVVQIITIVGSIWGIFNRKTAQMEARMNKIDSKLTAMQAHEYRRP